MADDPFVTLMSRRGVDMVVVTTFAHGRRAGCLVGFHGQCSIDPQRYAVWLSKANYTYETAVHATHLAVHFLDAGHRPLAALFGTTTGDDVDKFQGCAIDVGPGDVPLLSDCRNRFVGRRRTVLDDDGDHVCFVVEPVHVDVDRSIEPLRYDEVADLPAGHDADEPPR